MWRRIKMNQEEIDEERRQEWAKESQESVEDCWIHDNIESLRKDFIEDEGYTDKFRDYCLEAYREARD